MVNKFNKRGQDLSIGTLILIVLGIVVLVLLILGFSIGWTNLFEKIGIFGGDSGSIGDVAAACSLSAASQNVYDYCQNFKEIRIDGETEYLNCQDSRLNFDGSLNCPSSSQTVIVREASNEGVTPVVNKVAVTSNNLAEIECANMIKDASEDNRAEACEAKVNNKVCETFSSLDSICNPQDSAEDAQTTNNP